MGQTSSTAAAARAGRSAPCGVRKESRHERIRPGVRLGACRRGCRNDSGHAERFQTQYNTELTMIDIIHRVGIKAPVAKVYAALSTVEGVAGWWTKETTGVSKPGGNIDVRFLSPKG